MDVRRGGKCKCPQCDSHRGVKGRSAKRVPKAKVFEPNVNRKRYGASQPRGEPPRELHFARGRRIGECNAHDKVHRAEQCHRTQPRIFA